MKKIMVLFVAVAVATFAQAATFDWKISDGTYQGYSAYVFDQANKVALMTALDAGGGDVATTVAGLAISGPVTIAKRGTGDSATFSGTEAMFMIFNSDKGIADGGTYVFADAQSVASVMYNAGQPSPGTFSIASTAFTGSGTIGGATPGPGGDGPEPTSGLLLLVGGAMLALRRKQK